MPRPPFEDKVVIQIQNLQKQYGEHHVNALNGVSLDIAAGEFVALMGPSGCGKSTLLNILGTLDYPSSGAVQINGKEVFQQNETLLTRFRREKLGFIFQFFNLMSTLTVYENISLPLDLAASTTEAQRRKAVNAMLDKVGMSHRANFLPAQLSGGEMQRVAIARALIHKPQIILADEPTGNLDSENGESVLRLLKNLSSNFSTESPPVILMATHSEEAARHASRIIQMKDGQIYRPISDA